MTRFHCFVGRFEGRHRLLLSRVLAGVALALPWLLTAGCVRSQRGVEAVSSALAQYRAENVEVATRYAFAPSVGQPATPPAGEDEPFDPPPSALREYLLDALEHNPRVRQAIHQAQAQAQRYAQVTALPDPMVKIKVLPEPVRTAEGDNFLVVGVSQKLPIPGKLDLAGQIALEETRMAIEGLRAIRLDVVARVKGAYYQLYVLDKSISITRSNEDRLRSLIEVARVQVAAGRRGQADVLRAQVELSQLRADLIRLTQRRRSQAARLNELLGRDQGVEVPSPPEFGVRSFDGAVEALLDRAEEENPRLERLRSQIERDREHVRLARLNYWPDFTLGFEWIVMEPRDAFEAPRNPQTGQRPVTPQMSEGGSDNWAVTLGFNLPIRRHRIEAGISEARQRVLATQQAYAAARNMIFHEIEDALARVDAQRDLAELFERTIIPEAEQSYRVSQAGYSSGRTDFLDVIESWRKWTTFTIQYHRAVGEMERSVADLELAVGSSLSDVGNKP